LHSKTTSIALVPRAEVARFLLVTFALGVALQLVALRIGLRDGGTAWLGMTMWAPTVGVVAAGPNGRALAWSAARRAGFRYLPAALVIGFSPRLIQTAILALTGWGTWEGHRFELSADGRSIAAIHGVAMVLGVGPQSAWLFALNLAVTITVSAFVIAIIGGIGEEIGWRGFLQPVLARRFGNLRGTVLVGLLWSYWHLPANLAGYNDAQHASWSALVSFPLVVIAMSFGFGWLRRQSGSVWPVALAHGANNTLGSAFLVGTTHWWTNAALELLSMALVAAWVIRRTHTRRDRGTGGIAHEHEHEHGTDARGRPTESEIDS
jgi:uncharacterized protein